MATIISDINQTDRLLRDTARALNVLSQGKNWQHCTDDSVSEAERAVLHTLVNALSNSFVDLLMCVEGVSKTTQAKLSEMA